MEMINKNKTLVEEVVKNYQTNDKKKIRKATNNDDLLREIELLKHHLRNTKSKIVK